MYELNNLYCADCMDAMKEIPDKYFELAIVDPPYGGGAEQDGVGLRGGVEDWERRKRSRFWRIV